MILFSIILLNSFTVLLNNNDVRLVTAELVESEIPQQNINLLYIILGTFFTIPFDIFPNCYLEHFFLKILEKRLDNF